MQILRPQRQQAAPPTINMTLPGQNRISPLPARTVMVRGGDGGEGGAIDVPNDQIFTTTGARDTFFASNPGRLTDGAYCVVAGTLQRFMSGAWVDMSAVIRGPAGDAGPKGDTGAAGQGVPVGGTPGQILKKASSNDFDTAWADDTGGSGGGSPGPQGPAGEDGEPGPPGTSPHIGANGNWYIGDTDTGVTAQGEDGEDGKDGQDGTGVNILGSFDTVDDLETAHPTGNIGDAYLVGGDLYVWADNDGEWKNVGNIRGPAGEDGEDGTTPHIDATSGNWFIGTTDTGIKARGPAGDAGPKGEDGEDGTTPHIDAASGNWFIGTADTGIEAQGPAGKDGEVPDNIMTTDTNQTIRGIKIFEPIEGEATKVTLTSETVTINASELVNNASMTVVRGAVEFEKGVQMSGDVAFSRKISVEIGVNMNDSKITDLSAPSDPSDAVNKKYVDDMNAYSTSEINTGNKWVDGRMIYRRVFTGTTSDLPGGAVETAQLPVYQNVVSISGTAALVAGGAITHVSLNYYDGVSRIFTTMQNNRRRIAVQSDWINSQFIVIVEYTKP